MNAEQMIEAIRAGKIKSEDGSALIAVMILPDGKAEIAAQGATPAIFRAVGIGLIESAVRAEIKAAL